MKLRCATCAACLKLRFVVEVKKRVKDDDSGLHQLGSWSEGAEGAGNETASGRF